MQNQFPSTWYASQSTPYNHNVFAYRYNIKGSLLCWVSEFVAWPCLQTFVHSLLVAAEMEMSRSGNRLLVVANPLRWNQRAAGFGVKSEISSMYLRNDDTGVVAGSCQPLRSRSACPYQPDLGVNTVMFRGAAPTLSWSQLILVTNVNKGGIVLFQANVTFKHREREILAYFGYFVANSRTFWRTLYRHK